MSSEQFRRQLRHEATWWRSDGLISPEQYERLAQHYQFNTLEAGARDRFIAVLIGVGSVLLGLGILTFVAANWQAISREWKLLLLLSLFVVVSSVGYFLWQRPVLTGSGRERWYHRLGHGLLLLGALVLGANLALTGQLFHISGSAYELCFAWGLGVLAMSYGLRLTSLGVMAIALTGIGYWLAVQDLWSGNVPAGFVQLLRLMPLVAGALFIPLAYGCRSRVIFVCGAIAVLSSFSVVLADLGRLLPQPGWVGAIALVLPPALLWGYDDTLWRRIFRQPQSLTHPFRTVAQGLALLSLMFTTYGLSFHWAWTESSARPPLGQQIQLLLTTGLPLLINPNVVVLTLLTLLGWLALAHPHRTGRWQLVTTDAILLLFLGIMAIVFFWHWNIAPIQWGATYLFNLLFFLLATGLLRQGLGQGKRLLFWCGMVMVVLQILSRMLEYETGLMLKSLVFVLCGVGVILIGLWFERYVRRLTAVPSTPLSSPEHPL